MKEGSQQMSQIFLTGNDMDKIFRKILWFLEEKGVVVEHKRILKLLDVGGAEVNHKAQHVRFPERMVRELMEKAPSGFTLAAPDPEYDIDLPTNPDYFHVCTNTGARGIIDPETDQHRLMTESDIRNVARLVDLLEHIDMCAMPTATDVPAQCPDVHGLRALLESTRKHVWLQPHTEQTLPFLFELAVARSGGLGSFSKRPNVSFMVTSLTPYKFKSMDMEVILQACRYGVPIHVCSVGTMGGTSPISPLGTTILCCIEVLVQLIIAQLVRPGIPVLGLVSSLVMDMRTGMAMKGNPDVGKANGASARFIREMYKIPTHINAMTTDSFIPDGQAQVERCLTGLTVAGSGADIIGRAGELEGAKTFSPLQLVADNSIAAMMKHLLKPMTLDNPSLSWEEIISVSAGGHFLEMPSTLDHCRDGFRSLLYINGSRNDWVAKGENDFISRAREKVMECWDVEPEGPHLDNAIKDEMDSIVRRAEQELCR